MIYNKNDFSLLFPITRLIIILLFSTISIFGEETKVLLCEEANWPPYTYDSEGIATKGLSIDIMTELFHRLQINFELELFPMNRCILLMQTGNRDAITIISKNLDREAYLKFTRPIIESKGLVFYDSQRETPIQWESFTDLEQYEIGIVMGYNYGELFNNAKNSGQLQIQEVSRIEQNFYKLLHGRIDIMLANQAEMNEFLNNNPEYSDRFKAADKPYLSYTYHMGFSKKSKAINLIPRINLEILNMKNDGTLAEIIGKYTLQ